MSAAAVYLAIGAFAVVKAVVHSDALHIDPPRQNMDDLYLILFSILFLLFMIGGTIWILSNLATRCTEGPMSSTGSAFGRDGPERGRSWA
jgi:cytochrome o ubiquinol oxidase subunit IV